MKKEIIDENKRLKEKIKKLEMTNDNLTELSLRIHYFNQDLTELNIKYSETIEKQRKVIERLKNIIKEIRNQLDYLETYSSREDVFEDMSRRLNKIESIIGSDKE